MLGLFGQDKSSQSQGFILKNRLKVKRSRLEYFLKSTIYPKKHKRKNGLEKTSSHSLCVLYYVFIGENLVINGEIPPAI
jgi:hypothetical protein